MSDIFDTARKNASSKKKDEEEDDIFETARKKSSYKTASDLNKAKYGTEETIFDTAKTKASEMTYNTFRVHTDEYKNELNKKAREAGTKTAQTVKNVLSGAVNGITSAIASKNIESNLNAVNDSMNDEMGLTTQDVSKNNERLQAVKDSIERIKKINGESDYTDAVENAYTTYSDYMNGNAKTTLGSFDEIEEYKDKYAKNYLDSSNADDIDDAKEMIIGMNTGYSDWDSLSVDEKNKYLDEVASDWSAKQKAESDYENSWGSGDEEKYDEIAQNATDSITSKRDSNNLYAYAESLLNGKNGAYNEVVSNSQKEMFYNLPESVKEYYLNGTKSDTATDYIDTLSNEDQKFYENVAQKIKDESEAETLNSLANESASESGIIGKAWDTFVSVGADIASGVLGTAENVVQGFTNGSGGREVTNAYYGFGNKLKYTADGYQEGVMSGMNETEQFVYQTLAVSGLESLLSGALGSGIGAGVGKVVGTVGSSINTANNLANTVGKWGASAIIGAGAAQSEMQEMMQRGASYTDAMASGVAAGIFETLFEEMSIGNMSIFNETPLHATGTFKTSWKQYLTNGLKQIGKEALVNFSEEANTEIANVLYDTMMNGNYSDVEATIRQFMAEGYTYNQAKSATYEGLYSQIVDAGVGGALMGGVFGATGTIPAMVATNRNARLSNLVSDADMPSINSYLLQNKVAPSNFYDVDAVYAKGQDINNAITIAKENIHSAKNYSELTSALQDMTGTFTQATIDSELSKFIDNKTKSMSLTTGEMANLEVLKNNLTSAIVTDEEVAEALNSVKSETEETTKVEAKELSPIETAINLATEGNLTNGTINNLLANNFDEISEAMAEENIEMPSSKAEQRNAVRSYLESKASDLVAEETPVAESLDTEESDEETNPEDITLGGESLSSAMASNEALSPANEEVTTETENTQESADTEATEDDKKAETNIATTMAYNMGYTGGSLKSALEFADNNVSEEDIARAYSRGKKASGMTNANSRNTKGVVKAVSYGDSNYGVVKRLGGHNVTWDGSKTLHNAYTVAETIARATGLNVYLYRSDSRQSGSEGMFSYEEGAIYLDVDAGYEGEASAICRVAAHELTHFMASNVKNEFAGLKTSVFTMLRNSSKYDEMYNNEIKKQIKAHDLSVEESAIENGEWKSVKVNDTTLEAVVEEELVAEGCEMMLKDNDVLISMASNEKGVRRLVKKAIEIAKVFKNAFNGIEAHSEASKAVERTDELINKWNDALKKAAELQKERNEKFLAEANGLILEEDEGRAGLLSERYMLGSDNVDFDIDKVSEAVAKATGANLEESKKWVEQAESTASILLANNHMGMGLDFYDDYYEAVKKNSDYPQGTVDLTNLCRKRAIYTDIFDRLQKKFPDRLFTAQDLVDIRQALADNGFEVACALCFVEDRRQRTGEIAQSFIEDYKKALASNSKILRKSNSKGEMKDVNVSKRIAERSNGFMKKGKHFMADDSYIPNQYDLVTYKGFKTLLENHPTIAYAFDQYNAARGQGSARLVEGRAEYKREILKYTDAQVKKINDNGGLRIFSFSDFETIHIVDIIQVITDCSARGIKIQAYTKVPEFAKLVENTNIKQNRSLIPASINNNRYNYIATKDENGNRVFKKVSKGVSNGIYTDSKGIKHLVFDIKEGIDVTNPAFQSVSESNPDVGNILVGISEEQIRLAMEDDFVDYIIPFHSNQAKAILNGKGLSTWENYKTDQTDRKKDTNRVSMVNIYTQVIDRYHPTNKVEFVEGFLKECKNRNLVPRFHEFLNTDANGNYIYTKGYEKLLIDFKLFDESGNILPQKVVKPQFDNAYINKLIKDEIKNVKNREVASDDVYNVLEKKYAQDGMMSTRDIDTSANIYKNGLDFSSSVTKSDYRRLDQIMKTGVGIKIPSGETVYLLDNKLVYTKYKKVVGIVSVFTDEANKKIEITNSTFILNELIDYEKGKTYESGLENIIKTLQDFCVCSLRSTVNIRIDNGRDDVDGWTFGRAGNDRLQQGLNYHFGDEQNGEGSDEQSEGSYEGLYSDRDEYEYRESYVNSPVSKESGTVRINSNTLGYTEDRVTNLLEVYASSSNPNYAKAYIAFISPHQFLKLTTSGAESLRNIERESKSLDLDTLKSAKEDFHLTIEHDTGIVEGHEGRHRMVALSNEGIRNVPVLIIDNSNKTSKAKLDSIVLTQQEFNESWEEKEMNGSLYRTEVKSLIPFNYANEEKIRSTFSKTRDIMFSTRDDSVTDSDLVGAAVESNYDGQFDKATNQALNLYARTMDETTNSYIFFDCAFDLIKLK